MKTNDETLWTANDVAKYLQVSRSWVYHRAEAGELPCFRIGGHLRFSPEQVRGFVRGKSTEPAKVIALTKRRAG